MTGTRRYIPVPASVAERMGLEEGDLLDVTVSWPKTETYDPNDTIAPIPEKKGKRKKTDDEE